MIMNLTGKKVGYIRVSTFEQNTDRQSSHRLKE